MQTYAAPSKHNCQICGKFEWPYSQEFRDGIKALTAMLPKVVPVREELQFVGMVTWDKMDIVQYWEPQPRFKIRQLLFEVKSDGQRNRFFTN